MAQASEQKQSGYTRPDFSVRCPRCAELLAAQRVSCQLDKGGSILVATMARCINLGQWREDQHKTPKCGKIYNLQLTEEALNMGFTRARVLECARASEGNHFAIGELRAGRVALMDSPRPPEHLFSHPDPVQYNPDAFIAPQETIEDLPF